MKIKAPRDFWAGLMFIAFGLGFVLVGRNYEMGTAVRMGPAYFPTLLGGLLLFLGLIVFVQSFTVSGSPLPRFAFRPLIVILIAIGLFGALIRSVGLVPATVVLVVVSSVGNYEFRTKEVVIMAIGLTLFAVGVFSYGLGLPFKLWPGH
ncbi:MAG TPA: tripartite tricarboxylate transporter TctB family protein [Burkholderiales bacterium]